MLEDELLHVVVPVFNEEKRFNHQFWLDLVSVRKLKIWFVNDGSTDNTQQLLEELCLLHQSFECVNLLQNLGKANAIREGFLHIFTEIELENQLVAFIDADSALPVEEFNYFIEEAVDLLGKFPEIGSVWASRVALSGHNIDRNVYRHILGRFVATFMSAGEKNFPYDTQCGFKVFRPTPTLSKVLRQTFKSKWFMEIELLSRIRTLNIESYEIREIPLREWRDVSGSHIRFSNFAFIVVEMIRVKKLLNASKKGCADGSQGAR
jgi:glycosyltransferase involved in cell wall biosynthesis